MATKKTTNKSGSVPPELKDHQFGKNGKRSIEEARECGRKGGIQSGQTRREQKQQREKCKTITDGIKMMGEMLELPINVNGEVVQMNGFEAIGYNAFREAIEKRNIGAMRFIATMMGEMIQKIDIGDDKAFAVFTKEEIEKLNNNTK